MIKMADTNKFQSKKAQISEQLKQTARNNNSVKIPKNEKEEKRLPFTFTMTSSARRKLDKLAKENGYTSTSRFLNDLVDGL